MKRPCLSLFGGVATLLAAASQAAEVAGQGRAGETAFTRAVGNFGSTEFKATRGDSVTATPATGKAPNAATVERPRRGPGGFGGPIELKPDDQPAFDDPPAGFDRKREVWHVDGHGHDATHWRNNLWLFAQRLFQ